MRGGAPAQMAVAADERGADSAARRLTRAREGATWVRGEAVQLGARGIEAERQWMAGIGTSATSGGARVPRLRCELSATRGRKRVGETELGDRLGSGERLSGDELAGVTRGDANAEIDGEPSENRKGTVPS